MFSLISGVDRLLAEEEEKVKSLLALQEEQEEQLVQTRREKQELRQEMEKKTQALDEAQHQLEKVRASRRRVDQDIAVSSALCVFESVCVSSGFSYTHESFPSAGCSAQTQTGQYQRQALERADEPAHAPHRPWRYVHSNTLLSCTDDAMMTAGELICLIERRSSSSGSLGSAGCVPSISETQSRSSLRSEREIRRQNSFDCEESITNTDHMDYTNPSDQ